MTERRICFKDKKGFTIVELVIAMAIVILISVMAFTISNVSMQANSKAVTKNFFIVQASNFVKCYYLGSADYSDYMEFLTDNDSYVYNTNANIYYDSDFEYCESENAKYRVDLIFDDVNSDFVVECYYCEDGGLIYRVEV